MRLAHALGVATHHGPSVEPARNQLLLQQLYLLHLFELFVLFFQRRQEVGITLGHGHQHDRLALHVRPAKVSMEFCVADLNARGQSSADDYSNVSSAPARIPYRLRFVRSIFLSAEACDAITKSARSPVILHNANAQWLPGDAARSAWHAAADNARRPGGESASPAKVPSSQGGAPDSR